MLPLIGLLIILAVFGILTIADRWEWIDNIYPEEWTHNDEA